MEERFMLITPGMELDFGANGHHPSGLARLK